MVGAIRVVVYGSGGQGKSRWRTLVPLEMSLPVVSAMRMLKEGGGKVRLEVWGVTGVIFWRLNARRIGKRWLLKSMAVS